VKSMATGLPLKLWTIDDYEEMIERGILDADDRVELIRGEIVEMTPIGMRHAACVVRLEELLHELSARRVLVSVQNPIRLHNNSEPQPDVALLARRTDFYARQRPSADDVLLLIEVADTTLVSDRTIKLPLYAEAGIPEAWIVNLEEEVIEVYSEPAGGEYKRVRVARKGDRVSLPGGLEGL
jgi:Uma2 family endonuclease